jgi:hypothetical protein
MQLQQYIDGREELSLIPFEKTSLANQRLQRGTDFAYE